MVQGFFQIFGADNTDTYKSAIASGDQFIAYAVEDIKASLSESESQGNKYDDKMRDDYIPPKRKMMLLCKQKDN